MKPQRPSLVSITCLKAANPLVNGAELGLDIMVPALQELPGWLGANRMASYHEAAFYGT